MTAKLASVVMSLRDEFGLVDAVRSLLDQPEKLEVVVVNSGGGDSASGLTAVSISVPVVSRAQRLYPGALRNLGVERSTARYVAFLEADCLAMPGWAAGRLREHRAGVPAVACVMTNAYQDSASAWAAFLLLDSGRTSVTPTRRRLYCGLSLDRALFELYGGFREDLRASEDTELRERFADEVSLTWVAAIASAQRYPTSPRGLIADAFRRGHLQAAMLGVVRRTGPQSLPVAYWGIVASLQALRIVARTPKPGRGKLLRAWPLVPPASIAFAAGALTARFRPADGESAAREATALPRAGGS